MSKHCEVCNRSYPNELAACPYCAEAVEVVDDDVVELEEEAPEAGTEGVEIAPPFSGGPDSVVDLGLPTLTPGEHGGSGARPGEASGLSFTEWASLVEEQPAAETPASATFDNPSDVDLKRHVPERPAKDAAGGEVSPPAPPPAMGTEATLALPPDDDAGADALTGDLDAVRSIFGGDVSASFARRVPPPEPPAPPPDDDSALDLFSPGGEDAVEPVSAVEVVDSGIDLTPASVAEGVPAGHEGEAHAIEAVDSGLNLGSAELEQELVDESLGKPPAAAKVESGIDLAEVVAEEGSGMAVGAPPVGELPDSGVDLATLMMEKPASVEIVDSGVNLADLAVVEEASGVEAAGPPSDSGIDLGEVQVVEASSSGGMSAIQVVDSGVDLVGVEMGDELSPAEPRDEPVVRPISDSGLDLSGEDVVIGGTHSGPLSGIEKNSPDTSESGRDLIAEEVESGINLPLETFEAAPPASGSKANKVDDFIVDESATALAAGQLSSGAEEVDLTEMSADVVDSSSVDLGASTTFPAAPPEPASELPDMDDLESTRPFEARGESIHGEELLQPSEVNLGGRHDAKGEDFFDEASALGGSGAPLEMVDDESSGLVMEEEPAAADDLPLEETEPEPVSEGVEEEPEEEPTGRRPKPSKEKRRSTAGAWMGGVFVGGVMVAGALAGLWWFGIVPSHGTIPPPPTANNGIGSGTTTAPATLADKVKWMKSGVLDPAQKAALEAADETKPEEVAARGESRVRDYLRQQAVGGKPITADDADLKKGLADLDKEKDANPDALFYLGVTKEAVKDYDAALKVYKDGAERYKNDPEQKERFEAGVGRVTAKMAGGMGRAEPGRDGALLATLLVALEPADPAQPSAPKTFGEAGAAFYAAMDQAARGDYPSAVDTLNTAIKIHLDNRFKRLGQAQNPNSDPLEDIFARSCEKLIVYFQLQEKLGSPTLPVVKDNDPAKTLDALVTAAADARTVADQLQKLGYLDATNVDRNTPLKALTALKKDLDTANTDLAEKTKTLDNATKALEAEYPRKVADDDASLVKAVKEKANNLDEKAKTLDAATKAFETEYPRKVADDDAPLVKTVKAKANDLDEKTKTLAEATKALEAPFPRKVADDDAPLVKTVKEKANDLDDKTKTLADVAKALKQPSTADGPALVTAATNAVETAAIVDPQDKIKSLNAVLDKVAEAVKPHHLPADKDEKVLVPAVTKAVNDLAAKNTTLSEVAKALEGPFPKKNADADDLLVKDVKKAVNDLAAKTTTLKEVAEALKPNPLAPDVDENALVPAVKKAVHGLAERWSPDQMLTFWMPLLRERGRKDLADKAIADADRLLNDETAAPEAKARAHVVKALALRNQEKYPEARAELDRADLSNDDGEWLLEKEIALKETTNPAAYFESRANELRQEGRDAQAKAMLDQALDAAQPQEKDRLLIERGELQLAMALADDKARGQADLKAAKDDADKAKVNGAAEAFYLSGQINEELGQTEEAIQDYRQALAAHGALDAEGARYRAALARLLVLPRPAKVGLNDRPAGLGVLAALIAVGLTPGDLPGQVDPATQEAVKLADEILSAKPGDVPFETRAQAYAIKGLWTQALTTYAEGLRAHLTPAEEAGLMRLIQGHPALRQPNLMVVADPLEAEKHYSAGLRWYNDRQYDKAEKEFFTAVEQDGQDARYYYYLGLARLLQGNRDAYEDFEQGARLEQKNRPPRAAVSAALERIQGEARQQLNDIRDRPR